MNVSPAGICHTCETTTYVDCTKIQTVLLVYNKYVNSLQFYSIYPTTQELASIHLDSYTYR